MWPLSMAADGVDGSVKKPRTNCFEVVPQRRADLSLHTRGDFIPDRLPRESGRHTLRTRLTFAYPRRLHRLKQRCINWRPNIYLPVTSKLVLPDFGDYPFPVSLFFCQAPRILAYVIVAEGSLTTSIQVVLKT